MSAQRTLEVRTRHEGVFQIEIPVEWKITFARVNPQSGHDTLALRVYEADDKQRACFTDVVSFRDISIPMKRRVKKVAEKTSSESSAKKRRTEREVTSEYEWVTDTPDDVASF